MKVASYPEKRRQVLKWTELTRKTFFFLLKLVGCSTNQQMSHVCKRNFFPPLFSSIGDSCWKNLTSKSLFLTLVQGAFNTLANSVPPGSLLSLHLYSISHVSSLHRHFHLQKLLFACHLSSLSLSYSFFILFPCSLVFHP